MRRHLPHPIRPRLLTATVAAGLLVVLTAVAAPTAWAQPPAPSPTVTIQEETTTSTVIDNRELGRIIQRPNAGKAPESPGDPGGWLQVSLFFLICAIVVLMALGVWWRSRRLRERRGAAGMDPVSVARARGEGTRRPPTGPPTPVD